MMPPRPARWLRAVNYRRYLGVTDAETWVGAMRAVCQRVSQARVLVDGEVVGAIGMGWMILLGIGPVDDEVAATSLADKIALLRVFEDEAGKMNLSAIDVGAEVLLISQFTLYADLWRGRRPGFTGAAPPAVAEPLVERFAELLQQRGLRVATGRFGALMDVELTNHGPVTIVLSTDPWS
jgi:D-aminoacyl-tRNA deacylase